MKKLVYKIMDKLDILCFFWHVQPLNEDNVRDIIMVNNMRDYM